jgi:hypothetical protein
VHSGRAPVFGRPARQLKNLRDRGPAAPAPFGREGSRHGDESGQAVENERERAGRCSTACSGEWHDGRRRLKLVAGVETTPQTGSRLADRPQCGARLLAHGTMRLPSLVRRLPPSLRGMGRRPL